MTQSSLLASRGRGRVSLLALFVALPFALSACIDEVVPKRVVAEAEEEREGTVVAARPQAVTSGVVVYSPSAITWADPFDVKATTVQWYLGNTGTRAGVTGAPHLYASVRGLVKFAVTSRTNATISAASLSIAAITVPLKANDTVTYPSTYGQTARVYLQRPTAAWAESTLTHSNFPGLNAASTSSALGLLTSTTISGGAMLTDVQNWASTPGTNYGWALTPYYTGSTAQYSFRQLDTLTLNVTYQCNTGYAWNGGTTACDQIYCNTTAPTNGSVSAGTATYGNSASYSCNSGFVRTGTAPTCGGTAVPGTWSGAQPTCTQITCSDTAPTNGTISGTPATWGNSISYSCAAGFGISAGNSSRLCSGVANPGTLSGTKPTCSTITCSTVAPTNGSVTATSASYGNSVTYSCSAGFALSGTATPTCTGTASSSTGTWTSVAPTCVAITCSDTAPTNGGVSGSPAAYNASISYTCNAGYYLTGTTPRLCSGATNPGTLSGSKPTCTLITCSTAAPTNGSVTATSASYGNSVTYSCSTGFALSGTATISCGGTTAGGTWSAATPTCVAITCSDTAPTNGTVSGTPAAYAGTITYGCSAGYALSGTSTRTCGGTTAPGTLSGTKPTCVQISCNATAPTNGSISAATAVYGASVVYTCSAGYALTGTTPTCGGTANPGTWSGAEPTCVAITCSDTAPTNGTVSGTPASYLGTITYGCSAGYAMTAGNASRTCSGTTNPGTLSGTKPTCTLITCNSTAPTNGAVSAPTAVYGASLVYTCNAGFAVTGTAPTCGGAAIPGTWSGAQPTCSAISCNASAPTNGTVTAASAAFSGSLTWNCNSGYEISAGVTSSTLSCGGVTNPGTWSGTPPTTCTNIDECTVNATICGVGTCSDSAGSYSCACPGGYTFDGTTCAVTNACLASTPCDADATCTPIGTMSFSCACNTGYSGTGLACSPTTNFCAAGPTPVANGAYAVSGGIAGGSTSSYLATATYVCDAGYLKTGGDATCRADGTWSAAPSCDAIAAFCPAAPIVTDAGAAVVSGGIAGTTTTSLGAVAAYACNAGYTKSGSNAACQSDGTWSTAPSCTATPNFCGSPAVVANASTASVSGGAAGGTTNSLGATAAFVCATGYSKSGSDQTCLATGAWSTAPSCVADINYCASAPAMIANAPTALISGGVGGGSTRSYQATAAYTCDTGYSKSGSDSVCQSNGTWSTAPSCVVITNFCAAAPPTVSNAGAPVVSGGAALGSTQSYGATAAYTCNTGYAKSGVDSTCQSDGTWSGAPTCTAIVSFCAAAPATVPNAGAPVISGGAAGGSTSSYGAAAVYACDTGYAVAGAASSTCQADGTWSTAPFCTAIATFCAAAPANVANAGVPTVSGGVAGGATQSYGATAAYACATGYLKSGTDSSCLGDGTWSATPTCTVIATYCAAAPVVPNASAPSLTGGVAGDGTQSLGALASYACSTGYDKSGLDATCQVDTTWSLPPTCTANPDFCPAPTVVANASSLIVSGGVASGSTSSFGAAAVYTCTSGYRKTGGDSSCQSDGTWSLAPSCVEIDECAEQSDNCSVDGACTNAPGSFSCACNAGYSGDGVTCLDVDECTADTDGCDADAFCTNTVGAFTCTCNDGFSGDGVTCADIDECVAATDDCSGDATCTNNTGSFSCACNQGFQGSGTFCIDLDDCSGGPKCGANERCINDIGPTFSCVCLTGYTRPVGDPAGTCAASCGNGIRNPGEECDDTNLVDDDGCSSVCIIELGYACFETTSTASVCAETCGDGLIDPPYEQCDDGAANSDTVAGACHLDCRTDGCGDGIVSGAEQCDLGLDNSDIEADACRTDCRSAFCGDGVVDYAGAEVCDPGGGSVLEASICAATTCRVVDAGFDASDLPQPLATGCACDVAESAHPSPAVLGAALALLAAFVGVRRRARARTPARPCVTRAWRS